MNFIECPSCELENQERALTGQKLVICGRHMAHKEYSFVPLGKFAVGDCYKNLLEIKGQINYYRECLEKQNDIKLNGLQVGLYKKKLKEYKEKLRFYTCE
jgi:hypothetical protein